jgi:hypothetical protein
MSWKKILRPTVRKTMGRMYGAIALAADAAKKCA